LAGGRNQGRYEMGMLETSRTGVVSAEPFPSTHSNSNIGLRSELDPIVFSVGSPKERKIIGRRWRPGDKPSRFWLRLRHGETPSGELSWEAGGCLQGAVSRAEVAVLHVPSGLRLGCVGKSRNNSPSSASGWLKEKYSSVLKGSRGTHRDLENHL